MAWIGQRDGLVVTALLLFVAMLSTGVLPLPEDVIIVLAGVGIRDGSLAATSTVVACTLGAWCGDAMLFASGRLCASGLLHLPRVRRALERLKPARTPAIIERRGDVAYLVARVVPGVRGAVFFTAGFLGRSPTRFLVIDAIAALVHVPVLLTIGALLGSRAAAFASTWTRVGVLALLVMVVVAVAMRAQRRRKADARS